MRFGMRRMVGVGLAVAGLWVGPLLGERHMEHGVQSMTSPLRCVLVKRPDAAFAVKQPKVWHYKAAPDLAEAQREHDQLVALLKGEGVEVVYEEESLPGKADSLFVCDPAIVTPRGAVILRMGKKLRQGEEEAMEKTLNALGIPTLYRLRDPALAEGGDTLWLDDRTLVVGQGYRTNANGIVQLRKALDAIGVRVIAVQLPHGEGEEASLHLQSLISLVAEKKALVHLPLLPVPLVQLLKSRGFKLIEAPEQEIATLGTQVLAIKPGLCLAVEGNPLTKAKLETEGIRVLTYKGAEISLKTEGGPNSLVRPLWRDEEDALQ